MELSKEIRYLKREEIDIDRWDACINTASNGLIYALSFYLDAMCDHWDALVLNDYEAVMPLPWRKKWGIRYVYQPEFIQRLGVFGNISTTTAFYQQASKRFRFIHYNISNLVNPSNTQIKKKPNFFIHLNQSYKQLRSFYTKECSINIRKAIKRGCHFIDYVSPDVVVTNFRNAYGLKKSNITENDYQRFYHLLKEAEKLNAVILLGVSNEQRDVIYSAAIFKDEKRLYYILGAPTPEGRQKRATYFFIDQLLKLHANTNLVFDFEGSEIPDVASFYQKFGPATEHYYEIKINRLFRF